MKWFSHLLLGVVIMLVILGLLLGCNTSQPEEHSTKPDHEAVTDTLAVDSEQYKKHPDDDREV